MKPKRKIKEALFAGFLLLFVLGFVSDGRAQSCVAPPAGLVSWWPGDGNANDIAGNNLGTLQNGATYASGKAGQAFSFDGIDDFVQIANASNLQITGAITIDAWIYLRTGTFYPGIVSKGNVGNYLESYGLFTGLWNNTVAFLLNRDGTPGGRTIVWGPAIAYNTWTHVAGTSDGTTMRLYVNGTLAASGSHSGGIHVTADPVLIGKADRTSSPSPDPDSFLNGDVDEVEIFNRALSASEIHAIFAAGSAGKCKALISDLSAYPYAFNSTTGSTTITYTLTDVTNGDVELNIYNSNSTLVRTIDAGIQSSGSYSIVWNGKNNNGQAVPQGPYTIKLDVAIGSGDSYQFVLKWGSSGSGDGQFNGPAAVAVDSSGNVYVGDPGNSRIQKFDSNGNYLTKWGNYGSGDGQFRTDYGGGPWGIAVDSGGNVYVGSFYSYGGNAIDHRIQKFDSNGNFITKWGVRGSGNGQFNNPSGVAVDSSGNVYVADYWNFRIQKFDSNGNFITKWGSFEYTQGVAVDSGGNVYVSNFYSGRILKFDSNGNFIWGRYAFPYPGLVAVDSGGNVYVSNFYSGQILKFDSNGNVLKTLGSYGSGDGQFNGPIGVAVDSSGNVYVSDYYNRRIQKFAQSLTAISAQTDVLVTPPDTTTPVITPTVNGLQGANGWYVSNVTVSWSVSDPESAITVTSGCNPTTISSDTSGLTLTCTATSTGGTASQSVTVKRDATPPAVIAIRSPGANSNGWNNTNVVVTASGTDSMSGIETCTSSTLSAEGAGQMATVNCADKAGNSASVIMGGINIDKTAPVTTATLSPTPNGEGWNNTNVSVTLAAADNLSGVAKTEFNLNGAGWVIYVGPIPISTEGIHTLLFRSLDKADNLESARSLTISIDKMPPEMVARCAPPGGSPFLTGRDSLSGVASVLLTGSSAIRRGEFKRQETYTILDKAGNRLEASFGVKAEGHETEFTLLSLAYNGGAQLTLPENELKCEWAMEKTGTLKELEQKLEIEGSKSEVEVQAKFEGKKNETEIKVKTHGSEPHQRVTRPGLVFLNLTTNQGALGVDY